MHIATSRISRAGSKAIAEVDKTYCTRLRLHRRVSPKTLELLKSLGVTLNRYLWGHRTGKACPELYHTVEDQVGLSVETKVCFLGYTGTTAVRRPSYEMRLVPSARILFGEGSKKD